MAKDSGEMEGEIAPEQEIDFCTMGMFIVGESVVIPSWPSTPLRPSVIAATVRTLPARCGEETRAR